MTSAPTARSMHQRSNACTYVVSISFHSLYKERKLGRAYVLTIAVEPAVDVQEVHVTYVRMTVKDLARLG